MRYCFILLFLFPLMIFAQKREDSKLTTRLDTAWATLSRNWKSKTGDNPNWAKADFDDSSWQPVTPDRDGNISHLTKPGITWFRRAVSTDSILIKQLALRIYQTGASEVYLDGKLIHRLGEVSAYPDSVKYYSPGSISLSFPLKYNTKQILAIRFANLPNPYPIYPVVPKSHLYVWVTTTDHAIDDRTLRYNQLFINRTNTALGAFIVLFVLYLSFFFFFPVQKISLYFSLSNFFFAVYLVIQAATFVYHEPVFKFSPPSMVLVALYLLLQLYCIYRIFERKPGVVFLFVLIIGILSVPAVFLIDDSFVMPTLGILVLIDTIRINILSIRKNKIGAYILLIGMVINLIYWPLIVLSNLSILNIPDITLYIPLAFLIIPLSMAIYLGYAFGTTSLSLRQKLAEVEQLSNEKQEILLAQNETLEKQVTERTAELNQSLNDLRSTQTQLIQREKMASLGELTAGIAHEIQNPLNFVNNFSEVSTELMAEINDELQKGDIEGAKVIAADVTQNLEKIRHHGKRADFIVKGMLEHSRTGAGERQATNINILADEFLKLSYHGLRAKDKEFNAELVAHFEPNLPKLNIVQQDIGRVFVNLFNNAFYAVNQKRKLADTNYKPTVEVSTTSDKGFVTIKVKDNGNGIPANIKEKIMQPFFTTKPTGEGTGLGLSLSYDIVVKGHGGNINVETKEGEYTEFTITLPLDQK